MLKNCGSGENPLKDVNILDAPSGEATPLLT
jgi:hypothetical protein